MQQLEFRPLFHRQLTGEATKVDIGMLDCQLALLENAVMRYQVSGTAPGPLGARHPSITPFEAYKTKDGYIIISAGNDGLFAKLAEALENPDGQKTLITVPMTTEISMWKN